MSMTALFPELSPAEQSGFAFPPSLTDKYQPQRIADFCGLEKARAILTNLAQQPRTKGGWLFFGPPGSGKTSMGFALAREMDAEVHHIPAKECTLDYLQTKIDRCHFVPMYGYKRHLVLIDEADKMTEGAQISLLSVLDGTACPPLTTFVFTCNDKKRFERRFLERNRIVPFSSYAFSATAAAFLERVWDAETGHLEGLKRPNFQRIVKEANNSIRGALNTLELEIMAPSRIGDVEIED